MNRKLTNIIRFCMDELIPPVIRDTKVFMYPFYYFAYRGRNLKQVMEFKSKVYSYSEKDYSNFYNNLNSISRNRATDMNNACIDFIINNVDKSAKTVIDIGCGKGHLLSVLKNKHPQLEQFGFDIKNPEGNEPFKYVKGNIESLPFKDKQFDVVTCCHTIEHLIDLEQCIKELKRITKKQLFIVTPKQRYFYYTLDEHVNFFPFKEKLTSSIKVKNNTCEKLDGDWAFLGTFE
ncbi:MAG: class I SAM-dependent methyltransferase [Bacteroidetes bacterium]|nr:class I SAM-dependent methyltransferase [Bacteroidota bacterium]